MNSQSQENPRKYPLTRMTLVEALADHGHAKWFEFFQIYSPLIRSVARRSGFSESEAGDILQETLIQVSEYMADDTKRYRLGNGPFHGWLYNIVRWKIGDRFKRRNRERRDQSGGNDDLILNLPSEGPSNLEAIWDRERAEFVRSRALSEVQQRASPRQFQIFQMSVLANQSAAEVSAILGVSKTQVYLAKFRIGRLLRQEILKAERLM